MVNKYQEARTILNLHLVRPPNWTAITVFQHLDQLGYDWDGLRWQKRTVPETSSDPNWQPEIGNHVAFAPDARYPHLTASGSITGRARSSGKVLWHVIGDGLDLWLSHEQMRKDNTNANQA